MNFALAHVLGASIQTALLNTPLVVIVGWGLGVKMDLNFEIFDALRRNGIELPQTEIRVVGPGGPEPAASPSGTEAANPSPQEVHR